jgi:hypothetical protein
MENKLLLSSTFLICDSNARVVANVRPLEFVGVEPEEAVEYARLLVRRFNAHTDLLRACEEIVDSPCLCDTLPSDTVARIVSAVNKAESGAP